MPLFYHGFVPAAILIMVACLLIRQLLHQHSRQDAKRKIF